MTERRHSDVLEVDGSSVYRVKGCPMDSASSGPVAVMKLKVPLEVSCVAEQLLEPQKGRFHEYFVTIHVAINIRIVQDI